MMTIDTDRFTRPGDWMQTFTGGQFWPLDPRAEEIDPRDIAHALAMQCRYNGHCRRFYSVAEHCVLLSAAVRPENALWALLHDAAEAYVGDMVRPLKRQMPNFRVLEDTVLHAIAFRFDLPWPMPAEVIEADNRILRSERIELMPSEHQWWTDALEPLPVVICGWDPGFAEEMYLARLADLGAA